MKKVCVVGGGPAGLMAAYAAAVNGHEVHLIEKNEKLGKKIYITGKGRCNFTNCVEPDEFLKNVVRGERFLRGCMYTFTPQNTIELFENQGLSVKIERGNRAFPASDHASDVTKTLEKACKNAGVSIHLHEKALEITTMRDIIPMSRIVKLTTDRGEYECDCLIIATGGLSYPTTGSTGDGYTFARKMGHSIVDLRAGLCGLNLNGDFHKQLQGLSLKNVVLHIKDGKKTVFSQLGEALFTHFGISGPLVLSASSLINRLQINTLSVSLDFKPALDEITLDKRILRDFDKYKNKQISNALCELLPQKCIPVLLRKCGINERKATNAISKEERGLLVKYLKEFPLEIKSLRGFEEAIITSGGITLSEINPKTMESKKISGLKFCGEVLDIDAFTGGFNMQIAFSTGYAAGSTID